MKECETFHVKIRETFSLPDDVLSWSWIRQEPHDNFSTQAIKLETDYIMKLSNSLQIVYHKASERKKPFKLFVARNFDIFLLSAYQEAAIMQWLKSFYTSIIFYIVMLLFVSMYPWVLFEARLLLKTLVEHAVVSDKNLNCSIMEA